MIKEKVPWNEEIAVLFKTKSWERFVEMYVHMCFYNNIRGAEN